MNRRAPSNSMLARILLVGGVCVGAALLYLVFKLLDLQIVNYAKYQELAVEQQTRDTIVSPKRGTIYDRNMKALATSASVETICISPASIKDEKTRELIANGLSEILGVDYETVLKKSKNTKSYYEIVKKKVEKDVADKVREFKTDNKLTGMINIYEDSKRYYPYGSFASSVIGFCNTDNEGQYGIEAVYDTSLKGTPGRIITAKNSVGDEMPFQYEQYTDATDGQSLVLTIDQTVQSFLEKHLATALADNGCQNKVSGIVMDIKTGEILAMATLPDFDLNNPRVITDEKALAAIKALPAEQQSDATLKALYAQWRNKAIQDTYEPGSVFKIVTASIALEEDVVDLTDTFFCPGYNIVAGRRISCWKTSGHGSEDFPKGFQNSCNPVFMKVGERIGSKTFYEYMSALGLRGKTGIDLQGEESGIFHALKNFNEVELAVTSFGQTFKVTPIQLITTISGIVNDGKMMKPHFVKAYADSEGNITETAEPTFVRQIVSAKTSKTMRELMESVVSKGTGKNAYVRGYRVGGKTGTSEKRDQLDENGKSSKRIASFLGIAPADDPQVAVLVLLDEPTGTLRQGGQIAAPVVGRIMADILPYLGVKPVYTAEELALLEIKVPNLKGMSFTAAQSRLKVMKLNARKVGTGERVTAQIPVPGVEIPGSAEVILYMGTGPETKTVTVPSLKGLNYEQAVKALAKVGLYINATGAIQTAKTSQPATTAKQSPAAGSQAAFGSIVTVEFTDVVTTVEFATTH